MPTIGVDQTDPPIGGAKGNQFFAQNADTDRSAVPLLQLPRQQHRLPIPAQEHAHGSAWADANEPFIVLTFQHGTFLVPKVRIPLRSRYSVVIFAAARSIKGFGVA